MSKTIFNIENDFLDIKNASIWASKYLNKTITTNNILYLINYGKIANYALNHKDNLINKDELKAYYDNNKIKGEFSHPLSFSNFKEAQTTKHVHRLHPYKGKFIPQLVEYFLDDHIDKFKTQVYFKKNDIILDIFCGSGTTLAVANELNINAIGLELSCFNTILSNAKIKNYDLNILNQELKKIIKILDDFNKKQNNFEKKLSKELSNFNQLYFPNKEFKRKVALKQINEKQYGKEKEKEFLTIFTTLVKEFDININIDIKGTFLDKWYLEHIKQEIILIKNELEKSPKDIQNILKIILSRAARSCRATTHSDLTTLDTPITQTYFCIKHGRICKPLFSISKWFKSYAKDTIKRLHEFSLIKTQSKQLCLNVDSTNCNILNELKKINIDFATLVEKQKIAGIFSSPPYVGLINYHEQHAYAYDIFNLIRKDEYEIGALKQGQGKLAQEIYVKNISKALLNTKPFLKKNYKIFLVANDKFNLYPTIAKLANMKITNRFERPVLNRSEKNKNEYSESIFLLEEA